MKISPLCGCVFGLFLGASPLAAAPADEAGAILIQFLKQPNYTWTTGGIAPGRAEGTLSPLAAGGRHERGGYTKVDFLTGPHIPSKESPSTVARAGYCAEQEALASRWIFETRSGWVFLNKLPGAFSGDRSVVFRRPDHELAILLKHVGRVETQGEGVYQGQLSPDGAAELALPPWPGPPSPGPRPGGSSNSFPSDEPRARSDGTYREELTSAETARLAPPPPAFPRENTSALKVERAGGTFRLQTEGGVLTHYEIHIMAFISFNGSINQRSISLVRDLTDIGQTRVDIPADVKQKLGRPR